jgi:hypothetical protein
VVPLAAFMLFNIIIYIDYVKIISDTPPFWLTCSAP